MKLKHLVGLAGLAALALTAQGREAVGTWKGDMEPPFGNGAPQPVTVMLNADGTGTFKQGDQAADELAEVTIGVDTVSFKRTVSGSPFTAVYAGKVEGDTLTLQMSFEGQEGDDLPGLQLVLSRE